jgi:hypothetical protein
MPSGRMLVPDTANPPVGVLDHSGLIAPAVNLRPGGPDLR